ncbi:tigger transposable element-derived protein 1-like [Trichonephila clavipes]|nr:tigger transposable element-derived protein 1-like [Trichonephila clavipes]
MFEKTDGEEKQSIREFWKNYNIMNAVANINLSCNEITKRSLKGVWKNIWPDLSKSEDIGHSVDVDEIVELAKQTGLDEQQCICEIQLLEWFLYLSETPRKSPVEDAELGTVRVSQQRVELPVIQHDVDTELGLLWCLSSSRSVCSSLRSSACGNVS